MKILGSGFKAQKRRMCSCGHALPTGQEGKANEVFPFSKISNLTDIDS